MIFTFPRTCRLTEAEYGLVKNENHKQVFKFFICLSQPAPSAKLGIIIGKKSVRRAVDRNRCRRIIRESFRHHRHQLSGHFIVIVRYTAVSAKNTTLFQCLDQFWSSQVD